MSHSEAHHAPHASRLPIVFRRPGDRPTRGGSEYLEFGGLLRNELFAKFFDFRRRGLERGANRFLETLGFFPCGHGMTWRKIQHDQRFGVIVSLFVMGVFSQCDTGMGDVVVLCLECGNTVLDFLFPSRRHADVPTVNFQIHWPPPCSGPSRSRVFRDTNYKILSHEYSHFVMKDCVPAGQKTSHT